MSQTSTLFSTWGPPIGSVIVGWLLGVGTERWVHITRFLRRKPPIQIHVEEDVRTIFAGAPPNWVAAPAYLRQLPPEDPTPREAEAKELFQWCVTHGGVSAQWQYLEVTLVAWQTTTVVVQAFRVEATPVSLPAPGVSVVNPVGGASIERRRIDVELASWAPSTRYTEVGGSPASRFSFALTEGEVAQLGIWARIRDGDDAEAFDWHGYLDLLVGGKRKTCRVPERGEFRLVNRSSRPEYTWNGSSWSRINQTD